MFMFLINLFLTNLKHVLYVNLVEILDKTTQSMDKSEILFRLIQKSLLTLESQELNN